MKNKYISSMERIKMSGQLKEKILNEAAMRKKSLARRKRAYRIIAQSAACACVLLLSFSVMQQYGRFFQPPEPAATQGPSAPQTHPPEQKLPAALETPAPQSWESPKVTERPVQSISPNGGGAGNGQALPPESTPVGQPAATASPQKQPTPPAETAQPEPAPTPSETPPVLWPNPNHDAESLEELKNITPFDFKLPAYLPAGFQMDRATLIARELVQVAYTKDKQKICYRTMQGTGDCSGDYQQYESITSQEIEGLEVTFRVNNGLIHAAVWSDGAMAYSFTTTGLEEDEMVKIVRSVILS